MVTPVSSQAYSSRELVFKTLIETKDWKNKYVSTQGKVENKCPCAPLFKTIGITKLSCMKPLIAHDIWEAKKALDKEFEAYKTDSSGYYTNLREKCTFV